MSNLEMFAVRLSDEMKVTIKKTAQDESKTISELVREALTQYLQQRQQQQSNGR